MDTTIKNILNSFPEHLAGYTLLPLGIFMGYMMNAFILNDRTNEIYLTFTCAPFGLGTLLAFSTGIFLVILKNYYQKYIFEHFYYMMFGMSIIFGGAFNLTFKLTDPFATVYICMAGSGICYVPAITYINIRASTSGYRHIKITIAHVWYLLGVAIGSTITVYTYDKHKSFSECNFSISLALIFTTLIAIFGYITNEILHLTKLINYKKSLDPDFQRENENNEIFMKKIFKITDGNEISTYEQIIPSAKNNLKFIIFAIFSKIQSILYFYFPFYMFNVIVNRAAGFSDYYVVYWFGFVGIIVSTILSYKTTPKALVVLSSAFKLVVIIIVTIFCSLSLPKEIFWLQYFFFGFGYSLPDLNLLDLIHLSYNEIYFSFGYLLEMMIIGIFQVSFMERTSFPLLGTHSIVLGLGLLALEFYAFVLPFTFKLSVLQVKNHVMRKLMTHPPAYSELPETLQQNMHCENPMCNNYPVPYGVLPPPYTVNAQMPPIQYEYQQQYLYNQPQYLINPLGMFTERPPAYTPPEGNSNVDSNK